MKTKAAILVQTGKDLVLDDIEIPVLHEGQVLVEMAYSGVCHTQLLEARGHRGEDKFLPHLRGHEGSGIVRETGSAVTRVKAGDRVALSWIKGEGANVPGAVYNWNGKKVNAGAVTTFSDFTVVSENRLTVLGDVISMAEAAMLGCAMPTGLGAVMNTAKPQPGQSLGVFGCGGVGLCAVAGAALHGCKPIIAIDLLPARLEIAKRMGATHTINAETEDVLEAINQIVPGGLDFAIEASGNTSVMSQSLESVRMQGGASVIIGNAKHGKRISLNPQQLNQGKQLRGTWGGDSVPQRDYAKYEKWVVDGNVKIGSLMASPVGLEDINQAIEALEDGVVARPIIKLGAGR